ncbi:MAG: glycosyltransferase family 4 protein [Candidatus Bathyarchaeota archaeon]|nr:glycosyltransferase family 4 protein [Candidatus Bathyarchaeota archaeon]
MENKTIVFVKHCYPLERDTRLIKLTEATRNGGYSVKSLLWDHYKELNGCKHPRSNWEEFVLRLKVSFGVKSIPFWSIWWLFVLLKLVSMEWSIAYVIDLPSIVPVLIAGRLKNKPVIYESENTFIDQVIVPQPIRSVLLTIEKNLAKLSNAIVLVDELQIQELNLTSSSKIVVIYDSTIDMFRKYNLQVPKNKVFTMFYAGMLYKGKNLNLDKVITAIRDIEDIRVVFAGYGDLAEQVEKWSKEMPNKVKFIGRIPYHEVLERSLKCSLLFVLRDPRLPVNRYICGSKLFQAMMCSKPLLVNKGTSTAFKVIKDNCGILVSAHNVGEIKKAILELKANHELRRKLGMNGRKAYENKYSWEIMEQRLLSLYSEILNKG